MSAALLKALGALVVAGAGAVGGYNVATTGCPLRLGCSQEGVSVALVPVGATADGADACPLGCSMESSAGAAPAAPVGACCSGQRDPDGSVTLVSDTPAPGAAGCCGGEGGVCCEGCDGSCCVAGADGACCKAAGGE